MRVVMEFPEAGRQSALKFLEYFLSHQQPPSSSPDDVCPISPNLATISKDEAEAECLDMARTFLSKW